MKRYLVLVIMCLLAQVIYGQEQVPSAGQASLTVDETKILKELEQRKQTDVKDLQQQKAIIGLQQKGYLDLTQPHIREVAAQVVREVPSQAGLLGNAIIEAQIRQSSPASGFKVDISAAIASGTIKVEMKSGKVVFIDRQGNEHDFSGWKPSQGTLGANKEGDLVVTFGKRNYVLQAGALMTEKHIGPKEGPAIRLDSKYDGPATFILGKAKVETHENDVKAIIAGQHVVMDKADQVRVTEMNQVEFKVREMIGIASTFTNSPDESNAPERLVRCKGTCTFTITDEKIDFRSRFLVGLRDGKQGEFSGSYDTLKEVRVFARQGTVPGCLGCQDFDAAEAKKEFGGYVHIQSQFSSDCTLNSCREVQGAVIAGLAGAKIENYWHVGYHKEVVTSIYQHGSDDKGQPIFMVNTKCQSICGYDTVGHQLVDGNLFRIVGDGSNTKIMARGYTTALSFETGFDYRPADIRSPSHYIISADNLVTLVSSGTVLVGLDALRSDIIRMANRQEAFSMAVRDAGGDTAKLANLFSGASYVISVREQLRLAAAQEFTELNKVEWARWGVYNLEDAIKKIGSYAKILEAATVYYNELKAGKTVEEALQHPSVRYLQRDPFFVLARDKEILAQMEVLPEEGSSATVRLFGFDKPVLVSEAPRYMAQQAVDALLKGEYVFRNPEAALQIWQDFLSGNSLPKAEVLTLTKDILTAKNLGIINPDIFLPLTEGKISPEDFSLLMDLTGAVSEGKNSKFQRAIAEATLGTTYPELLFNTPVGTIAKVSSFFYGMVIKGIHLIAATENLVQYAAMGSIAVKGSSGTVRELADLMRAERTIQKDIDQYRGQIASLEARQHQINNPDAMGMMAPKDWEAELRAIEAELRSLRLHLQIRGMHHSDVIVEIDALRAPLENKIRTAISDSNVPIDLVRQQIDELVKIEQAALERMGGILAPAVRQELEMNGIHLGGTASVNQKLNQIGAEGIQKRINTFDELGISHLYSTAPSALLLSPETVIAKVKYYTSVEGRTVESLTAADLARSPKELKYPNDYHEVIEQMFSQSRIERNFANYDEPIGNIIYRMIREKDFSGLNNIRPDTYNALISAGISVEGLPEQVAHQLFALRGSTINRKVDLYLDYAPHLLESAPSVLIYGTPSKIESRLIHLANVGSRATIKDIQMSRQKFIEKYGSDYKGE